MKEWLKSIKAKLKKNYELIISSQTSQTIIEHFNVYSSLSVNKLKSYFRSQPILTVTCLILFLSLILMLLIYRYRRRRNIDMENRKRLEELIIKKQLKKTQIIENTNGKLIDYDHNKFKHQNDYHQNKEQIKQFDKQFDNNNYLQNQLNELNELNGQINELNYGNKERKCQNDQKQIELNSRLANLKANGHFCNKSCCDELKEMNLRNRKMVQQNGELNQNQLNNQSIRPQFKTKSFDKSPNQLNCCCCCCSTKAQLKLKRRREFLRQQLRDEFCDCEFCTNNEDAFNNQNRNQNSFNNCEQDCRRRCKIAKLIKDNVSSRNSLNDDQIDNEYRRLIRKNRHEVTRNSNKQQQDYCKIIKRRLQT